MKRLCLIIHVSENFLCIDVNTAGNKNEKESQFIEKQIDPCTQPHAISDTTRNSYGETHLNLNASEHFVDANTQSIVEKENENSLIEASESRKMFYFLLKEIYL